MSKRHFSNDKTSRNHYIDSHDPRAVGLGDTMSDHPCNEVHCPECDALIGRKLNRGNGIIWLQLADSNILVSSIDAKFGCGHIIHWRQTDEIYYRLMRHYPRRRTMTVLNETNQETTAYRKPVDTERRNREKAQGGLP